MKGFRFAAPATAIAALAVLALITGAFEAGTSVLTVDGHLLTVAVEPDPYDPSVQGLILYDQSTTGTTSTTIVTTWDPIIDQAPSLTLNPAYDQPVLVWSRQQGADFELAMAQRLWTGQWTETEILTNNQTNDTEPRTIVDIFQIAHVLWWPSGPGGSVYLGGFDLRNGHSTGQPEKPFEGTTSGGRKINTGTSGGDSIGGGEDPGTIGGLNTKASADPCLANPSAAPDHGLVFGCGRPAAYQLSACKLIVGVYDPATSTWGTTATDLTNVSLVTISVREIVQTLVDSRCNW